LPEVEFFGLHFYRRQYESIFDHFDVIDSQSYTEFGELTQNYGHYAVQGHSRSPLSVQMKRTYVTMGLSISE